MRALRLLREVGLWAAAAAGVLCIALFVAALLGGFSLVMFKTGSMAPTIPAGSLALVREAPAADIAVGDVVTVDRGEVLPVTHRVIEVVDDSGPVTFRMQGDANAAPDLELYSATTVRTVVWAAPGLAHTVALLSQPWLLLLLSVAAAALVTWAFWPRDGGRSGDGDGNGNDDGAGGSDGTHSGNDDAPRPDDDRQGRPDDAPRRTGSALSVAVLIAAASTALTLSAAPAHAAPSPAPAAAPGSAAPAPPAPADAAPATPASAPVRSVLTGDRITITMLESPTARALTPERAEPVVFGVAPTHADERLRLRTTVTASGPLLAALEATVLRCDRLTSTQRCPPDSEAVVRDVPAEQLPGLALAPVDAGGEVRWLDVAVTLGDGADPDGAAADIGIRVDAEGPRGDGASSGDDPAATEQLSTGSGLAAMRAPGPLAGTGGHLAALVPAVLAVVAGLVASGLARRSRAGTADDRPRADTPR
ncbi:signal peptidase I [Mycetocola reblochoni]|uniref:Signal peptidase I n=2 Tax=Mycetocola reblochoni TaxID=331618 RepID=A0A1R4J144_9MICO|nr:signal peptidase I [Mycetocola reblochoni]RLP70572.1 signal peptidase I [Mycetocola reblochoni]SJN25654.1 Signal peptidase I [Mycetocola reblochoni REB411]